MPEIARCHPDQYDALLGEKVEALRSSGQLGGLTIDEAAAIALYTAECDFYRTLNRLLRYRDRKALLPFFPYLRRLL